MINFYCNKKRFIHFFQIFYIFFTSCNTVDFCSCVFAIFGSYFQLGDITENGETKLTVVLGASY